jgi:hypothetical protein
MVYDLAKAITLCKDKSNGKTWRYKT